MPSDERQRRRRWWLIAIPIVVLVLAVVGPFVYIHFIQGPAPKPLTLDSAPAGSTTTAAGGTSASTTGGVAGTWTVTGGSQAGYRAKEVLFGQDSTAVGRTSNVTGTVVIDGTTVSSAHLTVDLTSIKSDQDRRDLRYRSVMETDTFPNATFELTEPIALGTVPAAGTTVKKNATGKLTIHGTTKTVTFPVSAKRSGDTIAINGTIPVVFADYGVSNPSFGPATVQDHGEIEFLVVLTKKGT